MPAWRVWKFESRLETQKVDLYGIVRTGNRWYLIYLEVHFCFFGPPWPGATRCIAEGETGAEVSTATFTPNFTLVQVRGMEPQIMYILQNLMDIIDPNEYMFSGVLTKIFGLWARWFRVLNWVGCAQQILKLRDLRWGRDSSKKIQGLPAMKLFIGSEKRGKCTNYGPSQAPWRLRLSVWRRGLVLARWSRSCSTPGPVSAGMGDRFRRTYHLDTLTRHSYRLSLLSSVGREI